LHVEGTVHVELLELLLSSLEISEDASLDSADDSSEFSAVTDDSDALTDPDTGATEPLPETLRLITGLPLTAGALDTADAGAGTMAGALWLAGWMTDWVDTTGATRGEAETSRRPQPRRPAPIS